MEPTTGLEPVTSSLPRKCSTTELCGQEMSGPTANKIFVNQIYADQIYRVGCEIPAAIPLYSVYASPVLERVMGIEPTSSAWKAEVLPLNYTRLSRLLPLPQLVEGVGFEPTKA